MAGGTQAHQVAVIVGAALRERNFVMDFLYRGVFAFGQTPFAQRVRRDILGADTLPVTSVPFTGGRIAPVLFVLPVRQLLMLRAVTAVG